MPSVEQHRKQAGRNHRAALALERDEFTDWAATALFYAALHWIEAYFARKHDRHHPNHKARERAIADDPITGRLSTEYQQLKDRSEDARYKCLSLAPERLQELRVRDYATIERVVRQEIGD